MTSCKEKQIIAKTLKNCKPNMRMTPIHNAMWCVHTYLQIYAKIEEKNADKVASQKKWHKNACNKARTANYFSEREKQKNTKKNSSRATVERATIHALLMRFIFSLCRDFVKATRCRPTENLFLFSFVSFWYIFIWSSVLTVALVCSDVLIIGKKIRNKILLE